MSKFLNEFKEFALRGNVLDLAVGVIIGGAFQGVVNSLVQDIISPIIGLFANQDFSNLVINIGDVQIKYGSFITAIINFIIMAFVIFLIVKSMNKLASLGKHEEVATEAEPTTKVCPYCCSEIPISATRCPNCTSELK
ncbi:large conductance mechanosensitive channel protein MscL [Intestinibacter sp.]|uniref:large conductance mechanosensitive channel protein MscL n=1 Tax=Intestinibacter sp. TaxID=1965304 RepID=UPI002A80CC1E|nr:large conductance mechanosensitive channel protein MscL [Intestinibacter sp.]MDY4576166.1 large conductance mechanosensitive channel protein MscL [Intestinibacter sp.]